MEKRKKRLWGYHQAVMVYTWFRVYSFRLDALFRLAFASAAHFKMLNLASDCTGWGEYGSDIKR